MGNHLFRINGSFLDLELSICYGSLRTDLYRKPQHNYCLATPDSRHQDNLLFNLINSEANRIHRLCDSVAKQDLQAKFYGDKLTQRGYPKRTCQMLFANVLRKLRVANVQKREKTRCNVLILKHSSSTNSKLVRHIVNRRSHMLSKPIELGFKLQPNLFLRLYGQNWHRYM